MYYNLIGKLTHIDPTFAVVNCAGVGYKCFTTMNTQRNLPEIGKEVELFTYLSVREDAMDLFGFISLSEKKCFEMLISVSGIGAKVGLSILSYLNPEEVAIAVASGDYKALTKVKGVGPKVAQRVVLELKDKVTKMASSESIEIPMVSTGGAVSASKNVSEAINALTVLGYSPSEASVVVAKLDSSLPVEELIRQSLKAMAMNM